MQEAFVQEHLHQRRQAADAHEFSHHVFATWLQVGQNRHVFADAREVVNGELHSRRMRHRQQMQHRIG